jgi:hypothetical protein
MVPQHGQSASLAVPQLGSRASSGRAWRLWAARHTNHSQGEAGPLGAQPSEPPPKPPIPLPLTAQVPPAQVGMVEARGRQGCQRVQAVWRGRRATRKGRRRRAAVGSRARGAASALARGGTVLVSERCVRSLAYRDVNITEARGGGGGVRNPRQGSGRVRDFTARNYLNPFPAAGDGRTPPTRVSL